MNNAGRVSGHSDLVKACVTALALAAMTMASTTASAITLGQIDDFEDGTTQGWTRGSPDPGDPLNITTGGPAGTGDNYLQISNGGGGRLLSNNFTQWTGNWIAAGVTEVVMDVINLGSSVLNLRLGIDTGGAGNNTDAFGTNYFIPLAVGSGWQTVSFPVAPTDWTPAGGGQATPGTDIDFTLSNVATFRIYSNSNLSQYRGVNTAGLLGVDNISAVPIPAAAYLFVTGLLGLAGMARRKTA